MGRIEADIAPESWLFGTVRDGHFTLPTSVLVGR